MSRAVTHDGADEPSADQRDRRHEVERRAMPHWLEELVADRKARFVVPAVLAVDEDILLGIAPVARRREELADRECREILVARTVRAGERRIGEGFGRHVEEDALQSDAGVPLDRAVDAEVALTVLRRQEQEEVAALPAEGDRLLHGHVIRSYASVEQGVRSC